MAGSGSGTARPSALAVYRLIIDAPEYMSSINALLTIRFGVAGSVAHQSTNVWVVAEWGSSAASMRCPRRASSPSTRLGSRPIKSRFCSPPGTTNSSAKRCSPATRLISIFHSVPYFGEHPLVQSRYLPRRSRRQPSILTFLAQDADSLVFCYFECRHPQGVASDGACEILARRMKGPSECSSVGACHSEPQPSRSAGLFSSSIC